MRNLWGRGDSPAAAAAQVTGMFDAALKTVQNATPLEAAQASLSVLGFVPGPIGAGAIAKLVHNCTGYILQTALAETFSMGIKAGVDPLVLWQAVRHGALGRRQTFDSLTEHFCRAKADSNQPLR